MYTSIATQLYTWAHYLFGFAFVFVWVPRLMFVDVDGSGIERIVANYLRMLCFVILAGFLLIITKLYEVIGIIGVIALWVAFQMSRARTRITGWSYLAALGFDLVEFPRSIVRFIVHVPQKLGRIRKQIAANFQERHFDSATLQIFITLLAFAIIIYMRIYAGVTEAAPKMSDGDTLLAWIKYIDLRFLMHDGVYPQGFFFYMATLGKFAVINPLYVLNFTGPLDSVLIIFLMFFAIQRLTKSTVAGLVAAILYGILGHHVLAGDWTRQAASETQEFGFPLAFATMLFLHRFLQDGKRTDFWVAVAGLWDSGLIHPLAYALCILASGAVLMAHAICRFTQVKTRLAASLAAGLASGPITLIPYGLAILYHIPSNQASLTFLTGIVQITSGASAGSGGPTPLSFPPLNSVDVIALLCLAYLLVLSLVRLVNRRPNVPWLAAGIWGATCFLIFEFGAYVTHSLVLNVRMLDLWAITECFVIGMGVAALLTQLQRFHLTSWIATASVTGFFIMAILTNPPSPILPYLVQWNQDVEAYLSIDHRFRDSGYMIVSPNFEYALVLGTGYHMSTTDFLKEFDPTLPPLTLYGHTTPDRNLAPHVFLYYYKHIFEISRSNSVYYAYLPQYETEYRNRSQLRRWMRLYTSVHKHDLKVFYTGPDLVVYEIQVREFPAKQETPV